MHKELVPNHIKASEMKFNPVMNCLEIPIPTNKLLTYTVQCTGSFRSLCYYCQI